MNNNYRINVRFDLRKEREREAAEHLSKLSEKGSGTRNRFIVDSVMDAIRRQQSGGGISLDDIRTMFREELQSVSVASTSPSKQPSLCTNLTDEEKAERTAQCSSATCGSREWLSLTSPTPQPVNGIKQS